MKHVMTILMACLFASFAWATTSTGHRAVLESDPSVTATNQTAASGDEAMDEDDDDETEMEVVAPAKP